MGEDDPPSSLEYIEDPYFPGLDQDATPSLDEVLEGDEELDDDDGGGPWPMETELYLRSLTLDQLLSVPDEDIENILIDPIRDEDEIVEDDAEEHQRVEAEFGPRPESDGERFRSHLQSLNRIRRIRFLTKKKLRDIKVTFVDLSKPYLVKISSNDTYKKFLNISSPGRTPSINSAASISLASLSLASSFDLLLSCSFSSFSPLSNSLVCVYVDELRWL